MTLRLQVPYRRIVLALALISLALFLLSILFTAYEWSLGTDNTYWAYQFSEFFSMTHEANLPSAYSALLLFSAALLSAVIAGTSLQDRRHWGAIALILAYMALDEAAVIHEMLTTPLRESLNLGGYLYFSWMLVGLPLAIGVAVLLWPFVRRLPAHTRRALLAAGFVYLGGAVVVEAISANLWDAQGGTSLPYSAVGALEELLEMLGVVLLIYGLLRYLAEQGSALEVQFAANKEEEG